MWIFWRCFIFLVKVKSVIRWWLRISQQESEVSGFQMSQKQKWEMVRRVSVIFATFLSCLDLFSHSRCWHTTFMLLTPHQQLNEQMHDPLMLLHWSMCTVLTLNSFSCVVADTNYSLSEHFSLVGLNFVCTIIYTKTYKYKNVVRKMNEKLKSHFENSLCIYDRIWRYKEALIKENVKNRKEG